MMKVKRYLDELSYCLQTGATLSDKLRLGRATIKFHASNIRQIRTSNDTHTLDHYRLHLKGKEFDLWLRTLGGDIFVFYEIFFDEAYRIPETLHNNINNIHTVVDLGSNIGLTSLYFNFLFPNAKFICVEPNPYNLSVLQKNILSLRERAHILDGAVSDHSGYQLFEAECHTWESKLSNNSEGNLRVRLYSMPEIISKFGLREISLLKIDIEGAEVDLLRKGADWLEIVDLIIIELHGEYSIDHLRTDIKRFGLEVYPPNAKLGNNMIVATRAAKAGQGIH